MDFDQKRKAIDDINEKLDDVEYTSRAMQRCIEQYKDDNKRFGDEVVDLHDFSTLRDRINEHMSELDQLYKIVEPISHEME